jgi:hypothetical protein
MKSVALVPHCPLPADTGGKTETWKHLQALRAEGECTIVSASTRPVGAGWTPARREEIRRRGFAVSLREDDIPTRSFRQWGGMAYAAAAKMLRLEKAFGHSNPYHRHAFPEDWWRGKTIGADLAVIHYSYWAALPCACPKAVILLDLWSDYMWEGPRREKQDLMTADLVVTISKDEENTLRGWGLKRTLWSPPRVPRMEFADSHRIGLLGSDSPVNREGLRWLMAGGTLPTRVYGGLAAHATGAGFIPVGRYDEWETPYRECGIILMPTALGMGVQIKGVESLAAGRVLVARKGAMRGLPPGEGAWIEVDSPEEMMEAAARLASNRSEREARMRAAHAYYQTHLDSERIGLELTAAFRAAAGR